MKYTSLFLILIFVIPSTMSAGPWTRKAGTGFLQLGFSTIPYKKVYNDQSTKELVNGTVSNSVVQLFGDVGITDELAVTAAIPVVFISAKDLQGAGPSSPSNSGIGDINLALRYGFYNQNGWAITGTSLFGLPTGDDTNVDGLLTGDGEFNVALGFAIGRSLYPAPAFASAELSYDIRSKNFSNDILYNIEVGYGLMEQRLYVILQMSGRKSTSSKATVITPASRFGLNTQNQEFNAIIPKLFYHAGGGWGVSVSLATATHGRNVAGGFVFAAGVSHEF